MTCEPGVNPGVHEGQGVPVSYKTWRSLVEKQQILNLYIVLGWIEPTIYRTRFEHDNYYITDAVLYRKRND